MAEQDVQRPGAGHEGGWRLIKQALQGVWDKGLGFHVQHVLPVRSM